MFTKNANLLEEIIILAFKNALMYHLKEDN
jgi:hypothetical protein